MTARTETPREAAPYAVGIMSMEVEGHEAGRLERVVGEAVTRLDRALVHEGRLTARIMAFPGPHLTPGTGAYTPLDFIEIGMAEKLERDLPFLLIVPRSTCRRACAHTRWACPACSPTSRSCRSAASIPASGATSRTRTAPPRAWRR